MADTGTVLPVNGPKVTRLFQGLAACPHCNANLIHSEIPAADRHYYLGMENTEIPGKFQLKRDDGRKMYFYRIIGQSSLLFDRVLAWTCPDCKVTDVIPGMEAKWAEEQAYWAKREKLDPESQSQMAMQDFADAEERALARA